jgi:hypothetical protein
LPLDAFLVHVLDDASRLLNRVTLCLFENVFADGEVRVGERADNLVPPSTAAQLTCDIVDETAPSPSLSPFWINRRSLPFSSERSTCVGTAGDAPVNRAEGALMQSKMASWAFVLGVPDINSAEYFRDFLGFRR